VFHSGTLQPYIRRGLKSLTPSNTYDTKFVTAGKVLLYRLFGRFGLAAILLPDRVVHLVVVRCKDGPMKSRYQMLEVGLEPV